MEMLRQCSQTSEVQRKKENACNENIAEASYRLRAMLGVLLRSLHPHRIAVVPQALVYSLVPKQP